MSDDVILRPATQADVSALAELGRASFVAKFAHLYRPQNLATFLEETHSPQAVAAELAAPDRLYCVAQSGTALAGYCKMAVPSTLPRHSDARRPVEIKQLYTDPELTGRGIGTRLLDWALAEARRHDADEVQLSVWNLNHDAQRLYGRHGFVKIADIHFRVGEQLDEEFLFALRL